MGPEDFNLPEGEEFFDGNDEEFRDGKGDDEDDC